MTNPKQFPNKFAGPCTTCKTIVAVGAGIRIGNAVSGKWETMCRPCRTGEPAPVATPTPAQAAAKETIVAEAAARPVTESVLPKLTGPEPTDEQVAAEAAFNADGFPSFLIEAGAGCGKTSTAKMLAESTTRRGAFMAYNRAIVDDAKTVMPKSMQVRTVHGYAFGSVGKLFAHRFKAARMTSNELARRLNVAPYYIQYGEERKVLQPGFLASHVIAAARRFCNSADTVPGEQHFAYIDGIDLPRPDGSRTYHHNDAVRAALMPALHAAWADWQNPQGQLRYDQDAYVKMFALGEARIPVDYIIVDEAQDLTGVMVAILRKNQERGVQIVAIGDSAQVIYEYRGTVNVFGPEFAEMFPGGRTTLTTSFRFGQPIADVANLLLDKAGAPIRLMGNPDRESTIGVSDHHDAVMCRTNAKTVEEMFAAMEAGRRFHLIGNGTEVGSFARGAEELQLTGRTDHPELACFSSWSQVLDYVDNDPAGDELKLMVGMIQEHGAAVIREALAGQSKIADADVVLSTVHKSKGLQFDTVRLASDFPDPGSRDDGASEWRLLYVAATRAKFHLDHTDCGPVYELTDPMEDAATGPMTSDATAAQSPAESSAAFQRMIGGRS